MPPPRLVHLAPWGNPNPGSFVPMLQAALRGARRRGWRTDAVLYNGARGQSWLREVEEEADLRFVAPGSSRRELRAEIVRLLSERPGPVLLHTSFTTFDVPALLAARGRSDARVVWHVHSRLRPDLPTAIRNAAKFALLGRRAAAVLCVAPDIAERVRRLGAPSDRVIFFPNAVDTSQHVPPSPEERLTARASAGLPEGSLVLLHFGWDWHRKGGDLFLEAVRRLLDEGRPVLARCIGGGDPANALARRLGIEHAVRVEPPLAGSRALFAAADVFVSSSRAEGMPFATLEALALSVPVAATDIAGHAVQAPGVGAIALSGLDADSLAASIRLLLDRDPGEAARTARAGRDWVVAHADLGPWAERLLEVYEQALTRQS